MLVRDQFGYFHDIPDQRFGGWSNPGFGEVVYDGLGNPLGLPFIAALAPLAAKLLPMAASLLPMLAPSGSSSRPSSPAPPAPLPPPYDPLRSSAAPPPPQIIIIREPAPAAALSPPPSLLPVQGRPVVVFRRRGARRRPVRVKVERVTEQVSVPPPRLAPPLPPLATEASGGVNGWYPAPHFGSYF